MVLKANFLWTGKHKDIIETIVNEEDLLEI
jgi:hypothetical protein